MNIREKKIIESALPENREFLEFMYQDNFFDNLNKEDLTFDLKNALIATHVALTTIKYKGIEDSYISLKYYLKYITNRNSNNSNSNSNNSNSNNQGYIGECMIDGEFRIKDRYKLADIDRPWTAGSTADSLIRSPSYKNEYCSYLINARAQIVIPPNMDLDFLNSDQFQDLSIKADKSNINKLVDSLFSEYQFISPKILEFFINKKFKGIKIDTNLNDSSSTITEDNDSYNEFKI